MKEVVQPTDIERPDIHTQMAWATILRTHSTWVRKVAPQFGLDTKKIILGKVLTSIIGDDANAFGLINGEFNSNDADLKKAHLYERMDWETTTQETPQNIKDQINKFRNKIDVFDWSKENEFRQAYEIWLKKIRNFTQHQIALNKDLRDAINYSDKAGAVLAPYWRTFIYGK